MFLHGNTFVRNGVDGQLCRTDLNSYVFTVKTYDISISAFMVMLAYDQTFFIDQIFCPQYLLGIEYNRRLQRRTKCAN
jgi:hypothetical protein